MTDRRQILCDWLTANGVDPNRVIRDGDLTIETGPDGRRLQVELFCVDADGRRYVDERGKRAATEVVTVPLTVEPPEWWTPYVKPTREQLLDAVNAVHGLHRAADHGGRTICVACSALDDQGSTDNAPVIHPCATVTAVLAALSR